MTCKEPTTVDKPRLALCGKHIGCAPCHVDHFLVHHQRNPAATIASTAVVPNRATNITAVPLAAVPATIPVITGDAVNAARAGGNTAPVPTRLPSSKAALNVNSKNNIKNNAKVNDLIPVGEDGLQRVAKLLAWRGLCSRREAERLIAHGNVTVDGVVVSDQGARCKPDADIALTAYGSRWLDNQFSVVLQTSRHRQHASRRRSATCLAITLQLNGRFLVAIHN